MNVKTVIPKFGENYFRGCIGFTMAGADVVSEGIGYFERWENKSSITVSHTFVITGDDAIVEAHIENGVQRSSLSKYLEDPHYRLYVRMPMALHPQLGLDIAAAAESKLGCKYSRDLILAEAASKTFLGHLLNKLFHDWPNRLVSKFCDRPDQFICSKLVAYALASQPEFKGHGVLANDLDTIDPQALFEDEILFSAGALMCVAGNSPLIPQL